MTPAGPAAAVPAFVSFMAPPVDAPPAPRRRSRLPVESPEIEPDEAESPEVPAEEAEPAPTLLPGTKPLTARRRTSAASRTGGKAAAGRHGGTRRR